MSRSKTRSFRTVSAITFTLAAACLTLAPFVVSAGLTTFTPFEGTASGGSTNADVISAIRGIVNFFLALAAIIAAAFIVIGGFRYIVSQGDEDSANQAKRTILYALIGLIVIALSGVVVNFIIANIPNPVQPGTP